MLRACTEGSGRSETRVRLISDVLSVGCPLFESGLDAREPFLIALCNSSLLDTCFTGMLADTFPVYGPVKTDGMIKSGMSRDCFSCILFFAASARSLIVRNFMGEKTTECKRTEGLSLYLVTFILTKSTVLISNGWLVSLSCSHMLFPVDSIRDTLLS